MNNFLLNIPTKVSTLINNTGPQITKAFLLACPEDTLKKIIEAIPDTVFETAIEKWDPFSRESKALGLRYEDVFLEKIYGDAKTGESRFKNYGRDSNTEKIEGYKIKDLKGDLLNDFNTRHRTNFKNRGEILKTELLKFYRGTGLKQTLYSLDQCKKGNGLLNVFLSYITPNEYSEINKKLQGVIK